MKKYSYVRLCPPDYLVEKKLEEYGQKGYKALSVHYFEETHYYEILLMKEIES